MASAVRKSNAAQFVVGIVALFTALLVRDWYRLHGVKLTRALKVLLNVANILRSFPSAETDIFRNLEGFTVFDTYETSEREKETSARSSKNK
ncbi:unnamed protein product [Gongylonema pulchrum]|uniref:ABC transmembrane type-1 domain-containing protein n=1 Tax=Gongylonema pulchrum TaxID=637853 RepID=A0A183DTY7_9BILA|nr:unnamed protein product [Gongylonema pulchrum]